MHGIYMIRSVERLKLTLADLKESDKEKRQALLHKVFDVYVATFDFPGCAFVDYLMEMYPSAKLVLNKRARAEDWVGNAKTLDMFGSKWLYVVRYWSSTAKFLYHVENAVKAKRMRVLGLDSGTPSVKLYEAHLNWVRGLAKARGVPLLEWMPQMGYAPLCEFLGKGIPEGQFPRMNVANDMRIVKIYSVARGLVVWVVVLCLVAAPIVASYAWFRF